MADFPFLTSIKATSQELPLFRCYAWDFDNDDLIYKDGKALLLEGNEALKVWIQKALKTERYHYLAYSHSYGSEIKEYISKVMSVGERKSELKRAVIESLMVNPYIKSVDFIDFSETARNRRLTIRIEITTIYGTLII